MRAFLRLIYNEIKVLRISVVVAAISLTLFTASLFSVLNIYFNLSANICENIDKNGDSLSVRAEKTSLSKKITSDDQGLFSGHKDGITNNAVLTNGQYAEFNTDQRIESNGIVTWRLYTGVAFIATDKYLQTYESYCDYIEGIFPRKANEICLSNYIATELKVSIGDTVCIGENVFSVSAIYDETALTDEPEYFICVDNNFVFDDVDIELGTSADTYRLYKKLASKGVNVNISAFYSDYIDGLAATDYFMLAISSAIFIANIIIIYAIFSMIVINRKKHICRMITLGASDVAIFQVFYLLLVCIVTAVNAVAYGLSNLFGNGIIEMCSTLFEMEFTVKRHPLILLVYAVINIILLVFMYLMQIKNISKETVLNSIKGE